MIFGTASWLKLDKKLYSAKVLAFADLKCLKNVKIRIIGLGFYRLKINGKLVSDELFSQPLTDYCERDLSNTIFSVKGSRKHYILYNEYNITHNVKKGKNLIEVELGCGWFKNNDRKCEGDFSFSDSLLLVYEIEADGKIVAVSNKDARYHADGFVKIGLYHGCIYDFSKEKTSDKTDAMMIPEVVNAPNADFQKNNLITDKVIKTFSPKRIKKGKNFSIYDCGVNLVGFASFVSTVAQNEITVEYAEDFKNNDIVSIYSEIDNFDQAQEDKYLYVYKGAKCKPEFVFYGFRYVKVYGKIKSIKINVVRTDLKNAVIFKSSDKTLNWYFKTGIKSISDNIHMGVLTDCPHREKFGYTGDCNVLAETVMLSFDSRAFFEKRIKDIAYAQNEDGYVPNTAPYMGGGGGIGGWGSAIIHIPKLFYERYGDKTILKRYLPNMEKYLEYLCNMTDSEGLVIKDAHNNNPLGDWSYPDKNSLPPEFVNTYFFVKAFNEYAFILNELSLPPSLKFDEIVEKAKRALCIKFYDEKTGNFCNGVHAANAYAVDIGINDEKTIESLCEKYERDRCFDTGIFGTDVLLKVLNENGKADLVYKLLSSEKYPSFGWWRKEGATTLWEDWSGKFASSDCKITSSKNHAMFAAAVKYLFYALCGISRDMNGITVRPHRIADVKILQCKIFNDDGTFVKVKLNNRKKNTIIKIKSNCRYRIETNGKYDFCFGNKKITI